MKGQGNINLIPGYYCKCLRKYSKLRLTQTAKAKYHQQLHAYVTDRIQPIWTYLNMNMYKDNLSGETVMFLLTMRMTFSTKSNVSFLHHIKFRE